MNEHDKDSKDNAERKEETKRANVVLPCGHEQCFEHALVEGILQIVMAAQSYRVDPVEPSMRLVSRVCEHYCIRIPSWEEMQKIDLAAKTNNTEVTQ